jgi:cell division protein FtsW (lipid II flippase)
MRIIWIWLFLLIFWVLAVYSVSIHQSFTLTLKIFDDPTNYFYFFRHLRSIAIAIVVALAAYRIPIKFFQQQRNIIIITVVLFIFQIFVFVPWIGIELNGARWWLDIPMLPSIQPSEFFKLWYVLFIAGRLIRKRRSIDNDNQLLISFVVINIIFLFIFLLIPDLGNALVMWVTGLVMALYAWMNRKKTAWLFAVWVIWILMFGSLASMVSTRFAYIQKRMMYFVSAPNDEDSRWIGWQNEQALAAIWWGWFLGKWYGKWLQKFGYIPEAQSDFIFAAFSEEIWFMGNMLLLWLYFYLAYYVLRKLVYIRDEYSKMIAVWIISLIIVQAFINIWVNLKILPNTWLTLPFISHGGSALMANLIWLILLYKIIENK